MAATEQPAASGGGIASFVEGHPALAIGGGVVLALMVGGAILSRKTTTPTTNPNGLTSTSSDLSGLTNGMVYVPTSTTFTTINRNSNNSTVTTPAPIVVPPVVVPPVVVAPTPKPPVVSPPSHPKPIPGPTPVPVKAPPPPQPKPPVTGKKLIWDQRYTIRGGENLTTIAASVTRTARAAGMPGSQSVSWNDLYAHNTAVINADAAAHHNPVPGGPWNDVFPGETITTPRWG